MIRTPDSIYNKLPTIYVLIGFAIASISEHSLSFASGVLFTLSGLLVFNCRISARTRKGKKRRAF